MKSLRNFIGRNLAALGLRLLLREELLALEDPKEVYVLLPSSTSLLQKFDTPGPENTKWKAAPILHVLSLRRGRIPAAFVHQQADSDEAA